MKISLRFGRLLILACLFVVSLSPGISAQEDAGEGLRPERSIYDKLCPSEQGKPGFPQTIFQSRQQQVVRDSSFEAGTPNPFWNEFSLNFGTPICDVLICGVGGGSGPRTGEWWCWFGGITGTAESGSLDQNMVIPVGIATLRFWLEIPVANTKGALHVLLDDDTLFSATDADIASYEVYRQVVIDISNHADGNPHTLQFASFTEANPFGPTSFFIDDVSIHIVNSPRNPLPPSNFSAYSDYQTPTEMHLNWRDPEEYGDGSPLESFQIIIARDGTVIDSLPGGIERFTDMGLNDGQQYEYSIRAKDDVDSSSSPVSAAWTAGGSPFPSPPTNFAIAAAGNNQAELMFSWINPSTNVDGTPMDDFAGIRLYEDGRLLATFSRSPSDTGRADSQLFTASGTHRYFITAIDNETPVNESEPSSGASSPRQLPFIDTFPSPGEPDPAVWVNRGAEVNDLGIDLPSPPYSLSLDGFPHSDPQVGDSVTLMPVDLSGLEDQGLVLSLWYQPKGNGNQPETLDSLSIDFLNSFGEWKTVRQWPGRALTPFMNEIIVLAEESPGTPAATFFHPGFQFRFRNRATPSLSDHNDHWLIDNVFLGTPSDLPVMVVSPRNISDTLLVGGSSVQEMEIRNNSITLSNLNYSISENPPVSWLTLNQITGTVRTNNADLIEITLAAGGLSPASYITELIVSGDDPQNPADTVLVSLLVKEAPVIKIFPEAFDVTVASDTTRRELLTIHNTGEGPLVFTIAVEEAASGTTANIYKKLFRRSPRHPERQIQRYPTHLDDHAAYEQLKESLKPFIPEGYPRHFLIERSASQLPDLMYYKFDEAGGRKTKNFANPQTAVSDSAEVLGNLSMGGTGQSGTALIGVGGSSATSFVDSDWPTDLPGDWAISMWLNNFPAGEDTHYLWGDHTAGNFRCFYSGLAGENNLLIRGDQINDVLITGVGPGPSIVEIIYEAAAGEIRVFVDGELNNVVPQDTSLKLTGTEPFKIGGVNSFVGMPANSLIDEFKMYNRVPPGITWLVPDTLAGTVAAGGSLELPITFDPTGLLGGDYYANIVITNNDPLNPEVRVPAHLFVDAKPDIAVETDTLIFQTPVVIGVRDTLELQLFNNGAAELQISDIASSNPVFSVNRSQLSVAPFEFARIKVIFAPTAAIVEAATLTIFSDDPETPALALFLEGEGIEAPSIGILPAGFDVTVPGDSSVTEIMTISNSGNGPLFFNISTRGAAGGGVRGNIPAGPGAAGAGIPGKGKPVGLETPTEPGILAVQPQPSMNLPDQMDTGVFSQTGFALLKASGSAAKPLNGIEEVFGSPENAFGPANLRGRGNLFSCTKSTVLVEQRFFLNISLSSTIWFLAYESDTRTGVYELVGASKAVDQGPGQGWYSSGLMSVPLNAGKFYVLYAQWEAEVIYFNEQNITPYPLPASFGELIAAYGWSGEVPVYGDPPPPTQQITAEVFGDPVAYYQTIVTRNWLSSAPATGTIPPGESMDISVTFDPRVGSGLLGGEYKQEILIASNDPAMPEAAIPARMFVEANGEIAANPNPLVFAEAVLVNQSEKRRLSLINRGAGILQVLEITSDTPVFSVEKQNFEVPPLDSAAVEVTFAPKSPGAVTGTLIISSDDPDTPTLNVTVEGRGVLPPQISVTPDSLATTVAAADSLDVVFVISNRAPEDGADLEWSASLRNRGGKNGSAGISAQSMPANIAGGKGPAEYPLSFGQLPQRPPSAGDHSGPLLSGKFQEAIAYGANLSTDQFVKFNLAVPAVLTTVGSNAGESLFAGDFGEMGMFFAIEAISGTLMAIDTANGQLTSIGPMLIEDNHAWTGMSYDASTRTLYAASSDGSVSTLYTVDITSGATSVVGSTSDAPIIIDIAFDNQGNLYAHDIGLNAIFKIDKTTAAATLIGATGFEANFAQGMDFDPATDELYLAAVRFIPPDNGVGELYRVDRSSGVATLIGPLGNGDQIAAFGIRESNTLSFMELFTPLSGVIVPGGSHELPARIRAPATVDTIYQAEVLIRSNDAQNPRLSIPVTVEVFDSLVNIMVGEALPTTFAVSRNYPNPFNPQTTIDYQLPRSSEVTLLIYNVLGQKVRTLLSGKKEPGYHRAVWKGLNDSGYPVSSGIYIYQFQAGDYRRVQKMILLK